MARRYRALAKLRLASGPVGPGAEFDGDPEEVAPFLRGKLVEEVSVTAQPSATDTAASEEVVRALARRVENTHKALDAQIALTRAAEDRAQQAEAELAALRAQAAPPSESLPPEEPPPEEPPGKPKAKKTAEAK